MLGISLRKHMLKDSTVILVTNSELKTKIKNTNNDENMMDKFLILYVIITTPKS